MTDRELLSAYQREQTTESFARLVAAHVDLVYSVARRHVGNAHGAEDVTQAVFLTLGGGVGCRGFRGGVAVYDDTVRGRCGRCATKHGGSGEKRRRRCGGTTRAVRIRRGG